MRAGLTLSKAARVIALLAVTGLVAGVGGVAASQDAWQGGAGKGVRKVRVGGDASQTRVVVELDRAARGKIISDGADGRFVLSLAGVGVGAGDALEGRGSGLVRGWTVERRAGGARLVLDTGGPVRVQRRFLLSPGEASAAYRYVIDLESTRPGGPAARTSPPVLTVKAAAPRPAIALKKVIVIDAGHGGRDPGTRGRQVVEKDITLAAARALKAKLEKTGRYRVVLTRGADAYVLPTQRVQIARRAGADLFISLHADSVSQTDLRGASVYTLSDSGLERTARKLIGTQGYFMNVDLPGRDRSVNQILLDLTQRATKNESSRFAEQLVDRLAEKTTLLRRSHRTAGFVVLLAPDVPAVLLELGYLTNPEDEAGLADKAHRGRMMAAVAASIDDYFAPPRRLARS